MNKVLGLLSDIKFGVSEYSDYESVGLDIGGVEDLFYETEDEFKERNK
jgi:hypothetical protein